MFDLNSILSSVRNEGVTWEAWALAYRPFPHSCKQRHQLEAWVDNIQWFIWNCPPKPRPRFFMFAHWSVMRERSIEPLLKEKACWRSQEWKSRDGEVPKGGHVTPSFQTDDKIEFKSNINLQVSLVKLYNSICHQSYVTTEYHESSKPVSSNMTLKRTKYKWGMYS